MNTRNYDSKLCAYAVLVSILTLCIPSFSQTMLYDKNDDALAPLSSKTTEVVGIDSVDNAVKSATATNRRTLIIAGHGEPGTIGMGAGQSAGYTQGKDLKYDKLADVKNDLQNLHQTYAAAPTQNPSDNSNLLVLSGCNSGKDTNGAQLVRNLSAIFANTYVVASNVCTSVGFWKKGAICAYQVSQTNPTEWSSRYSTISFGGGIVDDQTAKAVIKLVNSRVCVPCDNPVDCKIKVLQSTKG